MKLSTRINGVERELDCADDTTLFDLLRSLGLKSVKQGCDCEGTCGACTVLIDGKPILSCITPAGRIQGREVLTVEGLGTPDRPHPIQVAFADAGAVQCGYCTPGMVLVTKALLARTPEPTLEDVKAALSGNLCRCTGYVKIFDAVQDAAAACKEKSHV